MAFNVLIVDDSETIRAVVAKTLRIAKIPLHELHEAPNGKVALEILEAHWIDLVFADINMPVMNGIEMVDRMAEDGILETIPVIIVSTEGSVTRVERLKSKGISAYVQKPFTPELLRRVVGQVLGLGQGSSPTQILSRVLCDVLEGFASTPASALDKDEIPLFLGEFLLTTMRFSGHLSGAMALGVPIPMCQMIADKALNLDAGGAASVSEYTDAIKEMMNLTCGHWLTDLAGERALFKSSTPEISVQPSSAWDRMLRQDETLGVMSEGIPILVQVTLDHPHRAEVPARSSRG